MSILSGLTFVVFPLAEFASGQIYKYGGYYAVYAVSLAATLAGIVYICFIPESVTRRTTAMKETTPEASAAPSKNVIGRVVNFVSTGNRGLYDAMK